MRAAYIAVYRISMRNLQKSTRENSSTPGPVRHGQRSAAKVLAQAVTQRHGADHAVEASGEQAATRTCPATRSSSMT